MLRRPRRNRKTPAIRHLLQEHQLQVSDLVYPLFVIEGSHEKKPIPSMPQIDQLTMDLLIDECTKLHQRGVNAVAIFPALSLTKRDDEGREALNPEGLIPKTIRKLKREIPTLCVITDIALDPFTTHGHDGLVRNGIIENDSTVDILCKQAINYAAAGADVVAPSDMMDGRVQAIRQALDGQKFENVSILSYTAKYASSLYAPFREATNTSLTLGDKKTYQLNPANSREALLEATLDYDEGADILMVKPASLYLDIICRIKEACHLPIAAYHVSGEYAMVMAAHERGYLNAPQVFLESLLSIKRAGADMIFTYAIQQILDYL